MADPLDSIEMAKAVKDIGVLVRVFYDSLVEQGFTAAEALKLSGEYVRGLMAGTGS